MKRCFILLSMGVFASALYGDDQKGVTMSKKVALLIAYADFQAIEYGKTKDVLEKNGITVVTVSDQAGSAQATDGSTALVDKTVDQVKAADYDGIFVIGGAGTLDHLDTSAVHALIKQAVELDKVFGAICIAPRILAHAGVLKGRTFTGWDGDKQLATLCTDHFCTFEEKAVVRDGRLITANGPRAAHDFGLAIVQALTK